MMDTLTKQYYDRQIKLSGFGASAQEKLLQAKVLVIGAGGLGCPLLQYLITAGVGTIGIVDGDQVTLSNLHRQVLYNRDDIGLSKAETAAKKLNVLQPHARIQAYGFQLTANNVLDLFLAYDLIVDGTDNFTTRYLVNDACVITGKPLVSGALVNYVGQVSVFNYGEGPTYRCLFPEAPNDEECGNCSIAGVLNVLPGIVALYMANETIKVLTGYGEVLSGKLLWMDVQSNEHRILFFDTVVQNKRITQLDAAVNIMNSAEVLQYRQREKKTQLIDVRENWEFEEYNIGGINIPLYNLPERRHEIDIDRPIIFICQSGKKSLLASRVLHLEKSGFVFAARLG